MSSPEATLYPPADGRRAAAASSQRRVVRRFGRDRAAVIGLAIVLLFLLAAVAGPHLASHPPTLNDTAHRFASPSRNHPLGTDNLGRDEFSRIIHGARLSVFTALAVTLAITVIGLVLGILAGTLGRWVDMVVMRVADSLQALPTLILAVVVIGLLGRGVWALILTMSFVGWPGYARVVRAMTLSVRELAFLEAARGLGATKLRIMARHITPSVLGPVVVLSTMSLGRSLLAVSGLSFLGLGVPVGTPEWGSMLSEAGAFFFAAPQLLLYPGVAITLLVLACNMVGDGLREIIDPRTRGL